MNYRVVLNILGKVLLAEAILLLLPLISALVYRESALPFLYTMLPLLVLGGVLNHIKPVRSDFFAREGFVTVGLSWLLMSAFGAQPFVLSGDIPHYIDALFETVSGFTTTGASILTDVERMSRGCMFWRLFTHWVGGMGVLVFIAAVLPISGDHYIHVMRAEVPGPTVSKLVPKARQTARILYMIYGGLTFMEFVLLMLGGMSFYEAILHAFATAGTGGFSTNPGSIAGFGSRYIETVVAVFMMLFGVNFNLYFLLLIGSWKDVLKNEELHWYLGLIFGAVLALTLGLQKSFGGFAAAFHQAFFNVNAIMSTTGFGTVDFTTWPEYGKWILVLLMFCGGCAGSTSGGMKLSRLMILFKTVIAELRQMVRPRSVQRVEMDGRRVEAGTIRAAAIFAVLYFALLLLFSFLVSLDGADLATSFTAALSCLSNVGPGMTAAIGPAGSFAFFSLRTKLLLSLAMLLGRLELYPILVLFSPRTWKS